MKNDNIGIQTPPTDLPGLFVVGAIVGGGITIFVWVAWTKFTYGWPVSLSMPILLETARSFHWPFFPNPGEGRSGLGERPIPRRDSVGTCLKFPVTFEVLVALSLTAGGFLVFRMSKRRR